ncbi:MAG: hypothetical protein NDJ94_09385 [Vicinamibacteria bacterium]|nr:hypothetical protein [Vicinamibacteria bacterium]
MNRGVVVLALLVAALLLHGGVARPARARAQARGAEEARLHRELRAQRLRLAETTRAARRLEASREQVARAPQLERDSAPTAVRATIVARIAGMGLDELRLQVRPATGLAVAQFDVSGRAATTRQALAAIAALNDAGEARVTTAVQLSSDGAGLRFSARGSRLQPQGTP